MKRVVKLLLTIMLISLLASSSTMAISSSQRSEGISIVWIIHNYIYALYGHLFDSEERLPIESIDDNDLIVRGDADDLAGGKIGRIGSETSDPSVITAEGSSSIITVTD
jgi:hypothetical protein